MKRLIIGACALICLLPVANSTAIAASGVGATRHVVPTQIKLVHGPAFHRSMIAKQAAPDASQSENAVTYQINPTHTGAIDGPTLKLPFSVKWTASLGQASTYPVIANGLVFVGGTSVFALKATTGATIWNKATPSIGMAFGSGQVFSLSGGGQLASF